MSVGIKVRTISTLPETSTLGQGDLMEVSQLGGDSTVYSSNKVKFSTIEDQIKSKTKKEMVDEYGLQDSSQSAISLKTLREDVDNLKSNDMTIEGTKTFTQNPYISKADSSGSVLNDNQVPSVRDVRTLVQDYGQYYSTESFLSRNPLNVLDSEGKKFNGSVYTENESGNPFYYWHINDGQNDSSYFSRDDGGDVVEIKKDGILNIYGWLADNGNTLAQESWVGLFTKIYIEQTKSAQWVPISVQPWIQGKKSAIMQYVTFNGIGVTNGTLLKIVSGFNVNGKNSGLGSGNSLLFKEFGYTANTFIGYVIQK